VPRSGSPPVDDLTAGTGRLGFHSSPQDPLGEAPVRDVVAATYGTWNNTVLPARLGPDLQPRRKPTSLENDPDPETRNDHSATADQPWL